MSARIGRPIIGEKKEIDLKVRIGKETNEKLLKYCQEHNQKRAEVVREAIIEKLAKEK